MPPGWEARRLASRSGRRCSAVLPALLAALLAGFLALFALLLPLLLLLQSGRQRHSLAHLGRHPLVDAVDVRRDHVVRRDRDDERTQLGVEVGVSQAQDVVLADALVGE